MIYDKRTIPAHLLSFFTDAEIGLESTIDEYIARMVAVFREVKRVLRDDGTAFVIMGDSYAGWLRDKPGLFAAHSGAHAADRALRTGVGR